MLLHGIIWCKSDARSFELSLLEEVMALDI